MIFIYEYVYFLSYADDTKLSDVVQGFGGYMRVQ